MGTTLDLDDVAATSETAKRELADLRGILAVLRERLKAAEEVICTTKRERDCVTAEDWRRKAMHYEYQWRSCSAFANRRIGELTHSTDVNVRDDELYMCATDYEHELGEASGGTGVYASVADLKASRPCVAECGIVAVRVELVRHIEHGMPYSERGKQTPNEQGQRQGKAQL